MTTTFMNIGGAEGGLDMNVRPAWAKGYTGKGVVVSILDDGIQTNHPDLAPNYDPKASSDVNDNDPDPSPRDNGDNKHGTRCAGEVASVAGNGLCGVGVAFRASIGGVRMLDGAVSDAVEARALSLNPDHIDIYSASWGPEDDGKTLDGPGPLATRAFIQGVTSGRGGKGSIFVWASGNGGKQTDSCSCDGYTNSIYTLSISSATQAGLKPWYLEECPSTLATTYSSGVLGKDKSILTADMDLGLRPDQLCTAEHTGTSASAPLAAGLCALALEANPDLTWRDMQHIVVMTANPAPLLKEGGWVTNGAKRKVSHKFGYGLMDGGAMVELAEKWTTVPEQRLCQTQEIEENRESSSETVASLNVSDCSEVQYLEQVQCLVSASLRPRGGLSLVLTSPAGTPSVLLAPRPRDQAASALDLWPFLSVHFWGEDPRGVWTLRLSTTGTGQQKGILKKWKLLFYGTDVNPVRLKPPSLQVFQSKPSENKKVENIEENMVEDEREIIFNCNETCSKNGCYGPLATDCVSCLNYRLNGSCVEECPEEHYQSGGECIPCHSDCTRCTGPARDSCVSCRPSLYHVTDLGLCIQSCPHTYYQDEENQRCISCSENCETCRDSPDLCTSCEPHLVFYNHSCLPSCPAGTYEDINQSCVKNNQSNETCLEASIEDCLDSCNSTNCTACQAAQNSSCVTACDTGWYEWEGGCRECWPGCSSCYGGRQDECTACGGELTLARGRCLSHCPRDMYARDKGCLPCHRFCLTCNGGGPYACTSCAADRYLEESSGLCYSCDPACRSCGGPGPANCTSCREGRLLLGGSCLLSNSPEHHLARRPAAGEGRKSAGIDKRRSQEELLSPAPRQQYRPAPEYSPVVIVTVIAVVACLAILILFALLLATLQVR